MIWTAVKPKWSLEKASFFQAFSLNLNDNDSAQKWEEQFKALAESKSIKPGELMLPFRIMLVGGKFGPGVFDIAILLVKPKHKIEFHKGIICF